MAPRSKLRSNPSDTANADKAAADCIFAQDGLAPAIGWRVTLAHRVVPCEPFRNPRLRQCIEYVGASFRYLFRFYMRKRLIEKRRPFIDCLTQVPHRPIYGVPLGGIGCGSIGRGYQGEFCRFQMLPGLYEYAAPEADCFIVTLRRRGATEFQRVLAFRPFKRLKALRREWQWGGLDPAACGYHGLYPRSWTVYQLPGRVRLLCRQTSPVIGHDYQDSCLPVALFEWTILNDSTDDCEVSLTFCFQNGDGTASGLPGGAYAEPFTSDGVSGSLIHQTFGGDMPCTYGISAIESDDVTVTLWPKFDPKSDRRAASRLWSSLGQTGGLRPPGDVCTEAGVASSVAAAATSATRKGGELVVAVCAGRSVLAGQRAGGIRFCLAWHMPQVHFRAAENLYTRRHVRWFQGGQAVASIALAKHAFTSSDSWQTRIDQWQAPVLTDPTLPDWMKSALFNESYYLSDSGSIWLDGGDVGDWHRGRWKCPVKEEMGTFAYLEGHEYRMFTTYDVHAYASWAFITNFPKLQVAIQYDFAKAATEEDPTRVYWVVTNTRSFRNHKMAMPHDLGDPEDEPFTRVNGYVMMSSAEWRDLNPKFALTVYRDWKLLPWHNTEFLQDLLPIVEGLMEHCLPWDTDSDGLVENTGYADQTYDAWPMTGVSAYCAGLWLAAALATSEMLEAAGRHERSVWWLELYRRGRAAYLDRLWTGEHFLFDTGGRFADTVMSDQLFGHWMLRLSQPSLDVANQLEFLPRDAVRRTLATVYECNCLCQGGGGHMGLFNGGLSGRRGRDVRSVQSEESWTGVSYGVSSLLYSEGFQGEGLASAEGTYRTVWEDYGLAYQTPEAVFEDRRFRSLGYMRPLSVWAIMRAHMLRKRREGASTDV